MAKRGKIDRRREPKDSIERPVRWRKYQQLCLIVCEDEKTEPYYFRKFNDLFPEETFFLRCIGTGRDAYGVVEAAINERQNLASEAKKEVDFIWVVFDKDDLDLNQTRRNRFDSALITAEKENINLAFSNEVFELWLLLHFREVASDMPIPRVEIYEMLEKEIKNVDTLEYAYAHGDPIVIDKVEEFGDEKEAIGRAEKLDTHFSDTDPILANPSTKVYKLVRQLRDLIDYYNWTPE